MVKKYSDNEIKDWFTKNVEDAAGIRRNITRRYEKRVTYPVIGKMYFYIYDPKWKAKLPIYDKFPLVLPIEHYDNGFLGINLHFIPQNSRAAILGKLMEFANNERLNKSTRLELSYKLLKNLSIAPALEPALKRYLYSHIRSHVIEISANEWDRAIQLPVADFVVK